MAAVVVRAPAQQPSAMAGWNLNSFTAMNRPNNNGNDVAMIPAMNSESPTSRNPSTKPGPADMPTMAMNMLSPILLNTHKAPSGIAPIVGWCALHQPNTRPAISAPPLLLRLIGTLPMCNVKVPITAPMKIPADRYTMSVSLVAGSG